MPFCQVSRLTTHRSGLSSCTRPKRSSTAFLFLPRLFSVWPNKVFTRCVRLRVPHVDVDAVDDAVQVGARSEINPSSPMPNSGRADFLRIGRADGGDRPPPAGRLEETDAAVIFDAVERHRRGGRPSSLKIEAPKLPLKGEVVHGHHRGSAFRPLAIAHIGRRHRRLPVMGMHDIRPVAPTAPPRCRPPRSDSAAKRFQLSGQSTCRCRRHRGRRPVVRDAGHRARAGRARHVAGEKRRLCRRSRSDS
jgi:hypothetical protein